MINLNLSETKELTRHAQQQGWLGVDSDIVSLETAGDGNMNRVLRAHLTDGGSLIFKQSLDHVAKYPQIPAPIERLDVEAGFYHLIQRDEILAERTPEVIGYDNHNRILCMHDLGQASDFSDWYQASKPLAQSQATTQGHNFVITALLTWLSRLHQLDVDQGEPLMQNVSMRQLNHEHIFVLPLRSNNGVSLSAPLADAATRLSEAVAVRQAAEELGEIYLGQRNIQSKPCLLHGDFYPGSWLRHPALSVMVIDPEFCFIGAPEFDVGIMLAHLTFAGFDQRQLQKQLADYRRPDGFDAALAQRFAGIEVIRRLLGVAQLPLVANDEQKLIWLNMASDWLLTADSNSLSHFG